MRDGYKALRNLVENLDLIVPGHDPKVWSKSTLPSSDKAC